MLAIFLKDSVEHHIVAHSIIRDEPNRFHGAVCQGVTGIRLESIVELGAIRNLHRFVILDILIVLATADRTGNADSCDEGKQNEQSGHEHLPLRHFNIRTVMV
jgi:hypothetical protein